MTDRGQVSIMLTNTYLNHKENRATGHHIKGINGEFKPFDLPDFEITEETKMIAFARDDVKSVKAKLFHVIFGKKSGFIVY